MLICFGASSSLFAALFFSAAAVIVFGIFSLARNLLFLGAQLASALPLFFFVNVNFPAEVGGCCWEIAVLY